MALRNSSESSPRRTRRRGNNEGSVFQRPDGRWVAAITVGYDANGKRRRQVVYGKTKSEVLDKLTRLHGAKANGTLVDPSKETVAQYLDRWLRDVAKATLSAGSYTNYSGVIKNHIVPRIGGMQLQKLTPAHVQRLYGELHHNKTAQNSIVLSHTVLHRALKDALRSGVVSRNAADGAAPPKVRRREMKVLDSDQAKRLLDEVRGDRLEALYWVAITAGLRSGEILGLQWHDIDLKNGTLSVCRSQSEVNGHIELKEPKTANARRQIDLPAATVAVLWEHRKAALAAGHSGADRVFCNSEGGPLRRRDFHVRHYKPTLKRAGLPPIRFHDLRHTSATLMLSLGVHPKVVQERLGHSNISMTLDTYSHVMPGMQRAAADRLGNMLSQKPDGGYTVATQTG